MVKDSHQVWLVLSAGDDGTGIAIEKEIGLPSNSGPRIEARRRQRASQEGRPYKPLKNFVLESDLAIDETLPLKDHLAWMLDKCRESGEKLASFLATEGNSGHVFIFIVTDQDVIYLELNNEYLKEIAGFGLGIEVKFEKD